ncbi:lipoyl synthase [bacterium]|nr:MAG: lipoyl synthase [bacterium]
MPILNGTSIVRKPSWLNKKIELGKCRQVSELLSGLKLNTVCQEALCPNISECFSQNTATFLILGDTCTRACGFCAVNKGLPGQIDDLEPDKIAEAVNRLGLDYVVITSVTRDDLGDGGAGVFACTISSIRKIKRCVKIELLIPDFKGNTDALKKVVDAAPDVIGHNLETVPSLYSIARPQADYRRSLEVLKSIKKLVSTNKIYTKSGLMLGLGEKEGEVSDVLLDLRNVDCDFLSLGQYLCPGNKNLAVEEFVHPEKFLEYKQKALEMGFLYVESGPYVRSSYRAAGYFRKK